MVNLWYDSRDSLGNDLDIIEVFTEQAVTLGGGGMARRNVMSAFPKLHDFTIPLPLQDPQGRGTSTPVQVGHTEKSSVRAVARDDKNFMNLKLKKGSAFNSSWPVSHHQRRRQLQMRRTTPSHGPSLRSRSGTIW